MGTDSVADNRQVKKSIRQLQRVKTWQLVILLILFGFIAATFLRLNNIGMVQRRTAVLSADKSGDQASIANRLYDLQRHASSHINAGTGPFYLENQYKRDTRKLIEKAKNAGGPNGNINVKADAVCKPRYNTYSQAYAQCFSDELAKYPPAPDPAQNVKLPSTELYRYDFASPKWSPDFAGGALAVCAIIVVLILARLISLGILSLMLRHHYRGV